MATMADEELLAYFYTQYRQKLPSMIKKLKLSEDSLSSLIQLQKKKSELQLLQKVLEAKEEEFRQRMRATSCRWREVLAKEAQLRTYMEKSERLLKENGKMPAQALKKASKDRERTMQMESELGKGKRQMEALRNKHQKLCSKVHKYSIFQKFLEELVKTSQFEDIQEVLSHHKSLLRIRKEQLHSQGEQREMAERAKVLLDQYSTEKEAEILQYRNELVELQLGLDQAQKDVVLWETCWANIRDTTAEKIQLLGAIKLATFNLFQCIQPWLKPKLNVLMDDSHRQLDMVQQFIEDLRPLQEVRQEEMQHDQQAALAPAGGRNTFC